MQPLRDGQRVAAMCVDPEGERLESLQELEGIERRQARADVAQQLHPRLRDVPGSRAGRLRVQAELIPEHEAVIRWVGLGELGKSAVRPVEPAGIDDRPADRRPVAADELRPVSYTHLTLPTNREV